jgi:hypothetical protein
VPVARRVRPAEGAFPCRAYTHKTFSGHAYFHAPFKNGRLYGEDTAFCADWREIGGTVWLDPELSITHHDGNRPYPGHIGNWLRKRMAGRHNVATLTQLYTRIILDTDRDDIGSGAAPAGKSDRRCCRCGRELRGRAVLVQPQGGHRRHRRGTATVALPSGMRIPRSSPISARRCKRCRSR